MKLINKKNKSHLCRNCGSLVKIQFDVNGVPVDMVRLGYCKKGGC